MTEKKQPKTGLPMQVRNKMIDLRNDVEQLLLMLEDRSKTQSLIDLAFTQNYIRMLKDLIDEFEKPINIFYDKMRMVILPEKMDEEGVEKTTITDLGTLYTSSDLNVSVIKGMQEASKEWLQSNGLGDIIKETVNASTLKAAIKEEMQKGTPIPDSIYKLTPMTRAVIKKN